MHLFRTLAVFLCSSALALHAGDTPRKVAFSRGDAIFVANLDGTGPKKIASGAWPRISPDGTRVAFNTQTEKTTERHIAIADVATGKVTVLQGIPSDNNYGPVWSPDSSKLIFSTMADHHWRLALIDADGTHFRQFEPKTKVGDSLNSVAWLPDGQSFYAQDLNTLYHFALDGTLKEKRTLENIIPSAGFSSGQQFSVGADGHTLLVDADMDENVKRKDWDGPPPAIWTLDLATSKSTRITPKGFYGWNPAWVSDSEILCNVQPEKSKQRSIYRLSTDGKKREVLIKNAENPSVSK
jgi:TolB protein